MGLGEVIKASEVSAVIVTRGDVSLDPIIDSLPFPDIVIWNNGATGVGDSLDQIVVNRPGRITWPSAGLDLGVYGRYAATDACLNSVVYVQDDDVILSDDSYDALLAAYGQGHVTCNMPQRFRNTGFYEDHSLVGFGSVFHRDLAAGAFWRWSMYATAEFLDTELFHRTCDIVFTTLTPRILVDLPYTEREFSSAPGRMWTSPGHVEERTRMLELARKVRDA